MPDVDAELAQLLARCVQAGDSGVVVAEATGDHLILYVNPAFEAMTGYGLGEILGRNCRFLQGPDTDPATVEAMGADLRAGRSTHVRLVNYRADGAPFWSDLRISPVPGPDGAPAWFVAVAHDVTGDVADLEQVTRAATLDPLTGLMNRVAFAAEVERELVRASRHDRRVGVLFLDLDGFKQVNDTHGHTAGDGYLMHVASTLGRRLRAGDRSARHGGDEFTVLLTDLPADDDAAERAAAHLRAAFAETFTLDGAEHRVEVTVGVAQFPRDGGTVAELVANADADMYRRKRRPSEGTD